MKKPVVKTPDEVKARIMQVREDLVLRHVLCDGKGYITAEGGVSKRCGCMKIFRYLKELIKANIAQDYWALSFSDLKLDGIVKKVIATYMINLHRAKQNGMGLVLFGQNGTGKTSVMAEIGKLAIINGFKARYFTLSSYVDAVYSKDNERIDYYESADFLMIDELDKKASTANLYKLVDEFLRRMFNMNKSLILGTNWDEDEFSANLGESTYSLLKRRCEFLEFTGSDYSDVLQESFLNRLEADYNYFDKRLIKMAEAVEETLIQSSGNEE